MSDPVTPHLRGQFELISAELADKEKDVWHYRLKHPLGNITSDFFMDSYEFKKFLLEMFDEDFVNGVFWTPESVEDPTGEGGS